MSERCRFCGTELDGKGYETNGSVFNPDTGEPMKMFHDPYRCRGNVYNSLKECTGILNGLMGEVSLLRGVRSSAIELERMWHKWSHYQETDFSPHYYMNKLRHSLYPEGYPKPVYYKCSDPNCDVCDSVNAKRIW